jgi:hypothetical protein
VISEMTALQQRPAIQVAPMVFVVQTLVPVALAPLLLHENYFRDPLSGTVLLISLGVLLAGAAVLASSPALIALMAPEPDGAQASVESGTAESRSADSDAANRANDATDASEPSSVTTTTSPARSRR